MPTRLYVLPRRRPWAGGRYYMIFVPIVPLSARHRLVLHDRGGPVDQVGAVDRVGLNVLKVEEVARDDTLMILVPIWLQLFMVGIAMPFPFSDF